MNMHSKSNTPWVKLSTLTMTMVLFSGLSVACAKQSATSNDVSPANVSTLNSPSSASSLSTDEINGLLQMVEEEKLAGDVYQTLYERTGLNNFKNIVEAERKHQAAVQNLLRQYGITDPTAGKALGEFTQPSFTALYQDLIKAGSLSNADALKVGLKIEELDIYDLQQAAAQTSRDDIQRVYENLLRGSRNHLRSFHRALQAEQQSYAPEFLTQAQYNAIATSEQEKGNGQGHGKGHGKGM